MIWESYKTNSNLANKQDYTKHYVYEPDSFVPLLQTGYTRFIELIETPDYRQFQDVPYSIYKDPMWKTDTRKNKAELERVAFYHCDQVGTPQTLSNELGECIWEIKQDTWGTALEIKATEQDNPFGDSNIRFQGQYYDKETGLHYNRYRYYEPYSARYMSKDPIGLNGGFNNSAYVSDPNQWIDPMGLMGDKDKNASDYDRYSKIANAHYAKEKADDAKALAKLKAAREVVKINDARYEQQNRPSTGILGALLPNTMSGLARNSNDANTLRQLGAIRNNNLQAVAVAGYAPYVIAGAGEAAPVLLQVGREGVKKLPNLGKSSVQNAKNIWANPVNQAVIKTSGGSMAVDGLLQSKDMIKCKCVQWDGSRTAVAGASGAVFGAWGGTMAKAAGVNHVGGLSLPKNMMDKNIAGIVIFGNQFLMQQTSSRTANKIISDQKAKEAKK